MYDTAVTITLTRGHDGRAARVRFDNAARGNCLDAATLGELVGTLETAAADERCVVVNLEMAGRHFCTGWDTAAFAGLGAPHWDAEARGLITGLTLGSTRAHLVRAALESIAYQTRELVEAMEADSGERLTELRVDGGAAANNFLMQFQADILGRRIVRPADTETTALGAAYLAGLATGFWKNQAEVESFWRVDRAFEPQLSADRREAMYSGWKSAIARCLRR